MVADVVEGARLEQSEHGTVPATEGWFVVNVRDAAWETNDTFGAACFFEGESAPFAELGLNVRVLFPGRSRLLYHAEPYQESFLVLAGECVLLVEGEERPLRAWDFVHCPPDTTHGIVATGSEACVLVMAGARGPDWPGGIVYPRSELAHSYGVGVEAESRAVPEVLAQFPPWRRGRPVDWDDLPWA